MAGDVIYHVHFGPGKLGLGFVVPTVKELQVSTPIRTVLAARRVDSSRAAQERNDSLQAQHEYQLIIKHGDRHDSQLIQGIELVYTNDGSQALIDYLAHPDTMLITTAVSGKGFGDIATILAQGLRRRADDPSTNDLIIIACENPPLNSTSLATEVRRQLGSDAEAVLSRASFLNAIVDRVCPANSRLESGKVIVDSVEEYRNWIVLNTTEQARASSRLPLVLTSPIQIISSPKGYEFLEKRKTWLVNGTHVAIAFFARARGIDSLQAALDDEYVLANVVALQNAHAQALFLYAEASEINIPEGQPNNIRAFAQEVLDRIRSGPDDSTNRILADWIEWRGEPSKLNAFLRKSILRSIEPCEVLLQAGVLGKDADAASALTQLLIYKIRLLETVSDRTPQE